MDNSNSFEHLCRQVSKSDGETHIKVLDELHNTIAARNVKMNGVASTEVRTDFSVNQADGSAKWYEEFPTKTNPLTGKSKKEDTDLFEYDPASDKRGRQLAKDSDEYKQAHDSLWVLRDKFTPLVILTLPKCKD